MNKRLADKSQSKVFHQRRGVEVACAESSGIRPRLQFQIEIAETPKM
jgi:hypothetical protein